MKYLLTNLIIYIMTTVVIAQDSCPTIVANAMTTLNSICEVTGRNELCYGNTLVNVTTRTREVDFSQPGDIISLLEIESIRTSPYAEPDEWGLALMRIQANIPDTFPGQNVTFLLFGGVELVEAETTSNRLTANALANINLLSNPSINFPVIGRLEANTVIELVGRNDSGDWVYAITEELSGWVNVPLLEVVDDVMILDEVSDDFSAPPSVSATPMQAVYFSSGIGETKCNEVPEDGILIQSPQYEVPIELIINDVEIQLGSTLYLQAEAGEEMTVYVVEGFARITSNGETVNVPEGAVTSVNIDDELRAIDTPTDPEPYMIQQVASLPLNTMEDVIEIAEPISEESLAGNTIVVQSVSEWVDTGIELFAGQSFMVIASGEANICGTGDNPNCVDDPLINQTIGPEGNFSFEICEGQFGSCQLMPGAYGLLIGRIGNSSSFSIANGGRFIAEANGRLLLGFNDHNFTDNSGAYSVTIYVD